MMNIESCLKKLGSQYTPPMPPISVPLRVELTYSEPTETAIQRHIDNGSPVPSQRDLVVLVKKYCS